MKCKENCATAYNEEIIQLWWAESNFLPDMQALKRCLIIHYKFALHQEFMISLCLISRWMIKRASKYGTSAPRHRCAAGWDV